MKELVFQRHFLQRASWHAEKVGFCEGDYRATYARHVDRVKRLCGALASELDLGQDDRFAVMALNSHCFIELYHAAYMGAGVINPLNLRLAPAELEYILKSSGTKVCFVDAVFAPVMHQVRKAAGLEKVILIGQGDVPHDLQMEVLIEAAKPAVPDEPEETDPVVLMYTGGTTGLPKGVLLDQRAELLNSYHVGMQWEIDENVVFLHQTPMFHAASMSSILGAAMGGTSVFMPMFDPGRVPALIEQYGVTMTTMVPTMIAMMLNHPEFDPARLSSLQAITYGASPMPLALLEKLLALFPDLNVYQGYGMTEAAAVLTCLTPDDHRTGGEILKSAGRAVQGVVLSIQDEEGKELAPGQTGEVCARTGNLMQCYWDNPEATEEAFRGGWYHTGDAGYIDERGYLFLVDRVKDMIVTGGENVYSVEVENALASHEAVAQVAVIGIPHETWGEAVHAVVVLHEGKAASEEALLAHARKSIAGYKLPKTIEFRKEPLPLSGAMKVLKRELREPYWKGQGRGVN